MPTIHQPVLAQEAVELLDPQPGQTLADATAGGGGHARLLAERIGPMGRLVLLDRDPAALERAQRTLLALPHPPRFHFLHAGFDRIRALLNDLGISRIDGLLADLGFSSDQIEDPARGLSFLREGPLDMRLDPTDPQTAEDILASWNERDLADLLWQLGQERYSRRIARKIVQTRGGRPLKTTTQLADLVRSCVPRSHGGGGKIDPATRTFQALRIAVNDELGALSRLLAQLPDCLAPGGRAAIISFHSLEDRLVKAAFRNADLWQPLTKKPIQAGPAEVEANPRSRSAKLRAATLLPLRGSNEDSSHAP